MQLVATDVVWSVCLLGTATMSCANMAEQMMVLFGCGLRSEEPCFRWGLGYPGTEPIFGFPSPL